MITRVRAALCGLLLASCVTMGVAAAATINISPLSLTLRPGAAVDAVTLENRSDVEARVQVTGFEWNESSRGEMQLTDAPDLIFFPTLITLDPGEKRTVRIGLSALRPGASERTYRVFFEELPSPVALENGESGITVRSRFGIPVFVPPSVKPKTELKTEGGGYAGGSYSFTVANEGNVHYLPSSISLLGRDASGAVILDRKVAAWYLLAGEQRQFDVPLDAADCAKISNLEVRVRADNQSDVVTPVPAPKSCR